MAVYDVDKIDNLYDDFISLKNKFNNTYYDDYKSSYIKTCSDGAINKMESNLNKHYSRIQKIYNNINNTWREYLTDLKNVDKRLSGGKGSINAGIVSSKLSKLPTLREYKRDLTVRIKSISGVVGITSVTGWSEDRTMEENIDYLFKRTGATITTFGVSLVEGLGNLVEDAVDLLALSGAVSTSIFTGIVDLGSMITSKITGDESLKTNYTKQLWEQTRSFVSKDYTKQIFDKFYDDTSFGQWMKNNSYGFDTVREIGTEIGEVIGVIVLSTVTGGSAAVMYGAAKTAEHTEENWQDENTSIAAGLLKGIGQGTADGVFFEMGMKGDKIAQKAASKVGESFLKKTGILSLKMMFEGGTSVVQDSSSILLDTLFSDDKIVDQNGQVITFTNFSDKWDYYYEQAGGTEGLLISMGTASILSFISDRADIYGVKNSDSAIKNIDVDLNSNQIGKNADDISIKNMNPNAKAYSDVEISSLKKEYDELMKWKSSDKFLTDEAYYQAYGDKIGGNPYKRNIDRLNELEGILSTKKVDLNSNQIGKNADDISIKNMNPNAKAYSDVEISSLKKEYDELMKWKSSDKFLTDEAYYQAYGDKIGGSPYKRNIDRLNELEGILSTKKVDLNSSQLGKNVDDIDYNNLIRKRQDLENQLENIAREKGKTIKDLAKSKQTSVTSARRQELADKFAKLIRSRAEIAEPKITMDMKTLEDSSSRLVGLDFRLKSEDSLSRKIISDSIDDIISYTKSATKIGDSVRYTLVINDTEYTSGIKRSLDSLIDKGYKVNKFKNYWGEDKYQGVNVSLISPYGIKMELQFHTEDSFITKEKLNHIYYEISRNKSTTEREQSIADQIMSINQSLVKIPEGIINFKY